MIKAFWHAPVLRTRQSRANHGATGCGSRLIVLFPGTRRRIIAHFFRVVLTCLRSVNIATQIACALKGKGAVVGLSSRRSLAATHDHADDRHDDHGQQSHHQEVAKGFTKAQ